MRRGCWDRPPGKTLHRAGIEREKEERGEQRRGWRCGRSPLTKYSDRDLNLWRGLPTYLGEADGTISRTGDCWTSETWWRDRTVRKWMRACGSCDSFEDVWYGLHHSTSWSHEADLQPYHRPCSTVLRPRGGATIFLGGVAGGISRHVDMLAFAHTSSRQVWRISRWENGAVTGLTGVMRGRTATQRGRLRGRDSNF